MTYRQIETSLDISQTSIQSILHEHLDVCGKFDRSAKKSSCWLVSEMLKKIRSLTSKIRILVTGDETWIYSHEPESKQQSTVWVFDNELDHTKVVRSRRTSKKMIAGFFGLICTEHIATILSEDWRTVNAKWTYNNFFANGVWWNKKKQQKTSYHSSSRQC